MAKSENRNKYLIHIMVAGALALSWATIGHVNVYVHNHLRLPIAKSSKTRSKEAEDGSEAGIQTDTSQPPTPLTDITHTKVDRDFIRKMEGSVLKGYVPLATTTNSGVTIGDGFDLGQMHLAEFNKLTISDALKAKLQPYIGLTRLNAKNFLKAHPLTIDPQELEEVNAVAANKILHPLIKFYNQSSSVPFEQLPAQAQTAIFSFAYQYGPGFQYKASTKPLWNCFIHQNWKAASAVLKSFKMYSNRRSQEAQLLDQISS